jgi:hypothetical protein
VLLDEKLIEQIQVSRRVMTLESKTRVGKGMWGLGAVIDDAR